MSRWSHICFFRSMDIRINRSRSADLDHGPMRSTHVVLIRCAELLRTWRASQQSKPSHGASRGGMALSARLASLPPLTSISHSLRPSTARGHDDLQFTLPRQKFKIGVVLDDASAALQAGSELSRPRPWASLGLQRLPVLCTQRGDLPKTPGPPVFGKPTRHVRRGVRLPRANATSKPVEADFILGSLPKGPPREDPTQEVHEAQILKMVRDVIASRCHKPNQVKHGADEHEDECLIRRRQTKRFDQERAATVVQANYRRRVADRRVRHQRDERAQFLKKQERERMDSLAGLALARQLPSELTCVSDAQRPEAVREALWEVYFQYTEHLAEQAGVVDNVDAVWNGPFDSTQVEGCLSPAAGFRSHRHRATSLRKSKANDMRGSGASMGGAVALPSIEQQTSSSHVLNAATLSEQMPRPCGEEEIRLEMARWNHQRRSSILQNRRSAVNVEVAQVAVLKKLAQHARAACEEEKRADAASQARTKAMGRVGPGWYQSHKGAASAEQTAIAAWHTAEKAAEEAEAAATAAEKKARARKQEAEAEELQRALNREAIRAATGSSVKPKKKDYNRRRTITIEDLTLQNHEFQRPRKDSTVSTMSMVSTLSSSASATPTDY